MTTLEGVLADVHGIGKDGSALELHPNVVANRATTLRVLAFVKPCQHGRVSGRDQEFSGGQELDTEHHRASATDQNEIWVRDKLEQQVTHSLRAFSRFGWNEGQHEYYALRLARMRFENLFSYGI